VSLDWLNSDIGMLGRVNEGVEGSEDLVEYGEGEDGGCGQEQDNEENLPLEDCGFMLYFAQTNTQLSSVYATNG